MDIVLIVDDNFMTLNALASSLGKGFNKQFKVITANNGREAVQILEKATISLIITDLIMPEMDGFELLAYVNEHFSSIPCFVMSSAYENSEIRNQIPQDILKFYPKPIYPKIVGPEIIEALNSNQNRKKPKGISVISFLLMIEKEERTCLFEASLPNGKKSLFYFKKGILYQAIYENFKGEDAVIAVIAQKKALFKLKPLPANEIPRKINKTLEQLILEAKKQYISPKNTEPAFKTPVPASVPPPVPGNNPLVEKLFLAGKLIPQKKGPTKNVTVTNLSRCEVQFRITTAINIEQGDVSVLEFILDDHGGSIVSKKITITLIQGKTIVAEFSDRDHYDRLGPYIAFNGFTKENLI
ncbi:MAG: response regulator [Proteobacteria bacterium]|nr:response regulator [Pseudomonadota bacterium]